jgi:hypothetical protein
VRVERRLHPARDTPRGAAARAPHPCRSCSKLDAAPRRPVSAPAWPGLRLVGSRCRRCADASPRSPAATPPPGSRPRRTIRWCVGCCGTTVAAGELPCRRRRRCSSRTSRRCSSRCPTICRRDANRALLLLGHAGAFRRSELVALDVEHLRFTAKGLHVRIAAAKNDPKEEGERALRTKVGYDGGVCRHGP